MAARPQRLRTGTVGVEARAIPFLLRPGDIGGARRFPQDMIRRARAGHPSRTGSARVLFSGLHLPPARGVGPRIARRLQQILHGHAVGPPPRHCPCGRPLTPPSPHGAVGLSERAQQGVPGPQRVKLPQEQAYHGLDWFGRLLDHRARRGVDIPKRPRNAPRPPPRLLQGARIPALLEEMPLRLTHGAL